MIESGSFDGKNYRRVELIRGEMRGHHPKRLSNAGIEVDKIGVVGDGYAVVFGMFL
ncbi:MAG: hypothetical protein GY788_28925 [bacterium]|nr:hypothetical protein [bacterium]